MALLKTIAPIVTGVGLTRAQASAAGISLVLKPVAWSKKPVYIRNLPYTNVSPHPGQIEWRIKFGEAARAAKGVRGFEDGLPAVAARVKKALSGQRASKRLDPKDYPSKFRRTFHTLEELKRML